MSQPMTLATPQQQSVIKFKRKRYPLIHLSLDVSFNSTSDQAFTLTTCDLSNEELRLNCSAAEVAKLVPRTAHHRPDEKIFHHVKLHLNEQESIPLKLQVNFCRRYSQKEFKLGFFITELEDFAQEKLQERLELALAQNARPASMLN